MMRSHLRKLALSATSVAIAFCYGGLTSVLQLIPGPLNGLANTVSGWCMPVILLAWWLGGRPVRAAVTGALGFVALCGGYSLVSTMRGHPDLSTTWALIGLVAGPIIGGAASLVRLARPRVAAVASGVLAGILAGDASYGLVANTHYWATWLIAAAAAVALIVVTGARRRLPPRDYALQLAVAVGVAALYWLAFSLLGAVMGAL